ncbi:MAG: hypothetical protein DWQ30_01585 [Acidobacteria bacterium]|nr:MAG: hypothetical protein DWQ30_01585 [Acidobacteriota bacterium]
MSFRRYFATAVLATSVLAASTASAAEIVLAVEDMPGEGFNDPTPRSPVPGNPGTTLGQQRLIAFQIAADIWGSVIDSDETIVISVSMPELDCDANSALLGSAGPESVFGNFPNAPLFNTWYTGALADTLAADDLDPGSPDIVAEFNDALDSDPGCLGGVGWHYGINEAPGQAIDFIETVLHEIAHGLGFLSLVNLNTGAKFQGFDDVYSNFLFDTQQNLPWPVMSNTQRRNSATGGSLTWNGPQVLADAFPLVSGVHPSGRVRMYSPNPLEIGSSVSHFDTSLFPNELMEPFDTGDGEAIVTPALMEDLGWPLREGVEPCFDGPTTLCLNDDRFEVSVQWENFEGAVGDGMSVPLSGDSGLMYFFEPDNLELLIKVLDGCGFNGRFWVFFAATTNVEFTVTVTDSLTGDSETYFNPLGQPADAVTDTDAFDTCSAATVGSGMRLARRFDPAWSGSNDLSPGAIADRAGREAEKLLAQLAALSGFDPTGGDLGSAAAGLGAAPRTRGGRGLSVPAGLDLRSRQAPAGDDPQVVGAAVSTPTGSTYDPFIGEGLSNGQVFSLYAPANPNLTVTFDGLTESQPAFVDGTVPRVTESVSVRPSGNAVDVEISIFSRGGEDLFPDGFTGGGQPLTDGAMILGFFNSANPLDFPNTGVQQATLTMRRNNTVFDVLDFGPGTPNPIDVFFFEDSGTPWAGDFAVLIADLVGEGVDALDLEIRIGVEPDDPPVQPFDCLPGPRTLCLGGDDGDRFEVEVDWTDFELDSGPGNAIGLSGSETSGLFWFFDVQNIEMLVKVLDGCGLNNRFWVFFAATTNVEYTLRVTDSETGESETYFNPLGQAAPAVTDTSAFATCP